MTDSRIFERCAELGVDRERLERCLDQHDNWGALVHSFEYLTVLGVVATAWKDEHQEGLDE